ncbi:MAG: TetR family transcriptional regulator [Rhodobacteraceae bacterium]|jgi:AcrR family transcriptional regulator|nr:TetR family transcriptional regulator [Paracoccaceae bacterium]
MTRGTRLGKADWLDAGLAALAAEGPAALRAEALARQLNTTKGSFYWHFQDVPAFQAAVLAAWAEALIARLPTATATPPTTALRALAQGLAAPAGTSPAEQAERAIRAMALSDTAAAQAVAQVDRARHASISAFLAQIGVSNPEIATLILAAAQGMPADASGDPMGTLVDLVLALR